MIDFQTWEILGTFAGAMAATKFLTDLVKAFVKIEGKQALGVAVIIGILVVVLAKFFTGLSQPPELVLAVLNGIAVGFAASGFNDALARKG
jgi:hypothetical protein